MNEKINPKISVWNKKYRPSSGDLLNSSNLLNALKYQEGITNNKKGECGSIVKYTNNQAYPNHYSCDGLFNIDIDHCSNISQIIYDNFENLTQKFPNLLAICFSHSRSIHAFVYDERFIGDNIDRDEYNYQATVYLAMFARVIKLMCNIDLREIDGALDKGSGVITKLIYLNKSEFKWNPYCVGVSDINLSNKDIEKLKAEYHMLFKSFSQIYNKESLNYVLSVKREEDNMIFNTSVPRIVNRDTWFDKWSGNDLRRMIASNILVYCDGDKEKAKQIIIENFDAPQNKEIISWLRNNYHEFYNKGLYEWLFKSNEDKILLDQNQFLNDVLDDSIWNDSKYVYIVSNTNTGKTEWSKRMIKENNNVIVLYPNKVLRDGKKHGVEEWTYENDAKDINKEKAVNTTIDVFRKKFYVDDMKDKIVIMDEAHLLQDYISMQERREVIKDTINLIQYADKVIFLSATPKQEMNLFKFKVMRYEKKQNQILHVHCEILDIEKIEKGNKISKTNAVYNYINRYVDEKILSKGKKVIIFSDRAQRVWKKYGLQEGIDDKTCGLYRSEDCTKDCLDAVNNDNKLIYPITLATRYLGVGVEVKEEEDGYIVMNLDEGFDIRFIEQCIGRFRKAKNIHLYLFASREAGRPLVKEEEEEIKRLLLSYYVDLYEQTEDGEMKMNILKAMKLNTWDGMELDEDLRKAIGMLLANNIVGNMSYASLTDVRVMVEKLPYKSVVWNASVRKLKEKEIKEGLKICENNEDELKCYVESLDDKQLKKLMEYTVSEILDRGMVPFKDRIVARKILKMIKPIVRRGWSFSEWLKFFDGKIGTMVKEKDKMIRYCKWMRGDYMDEDGGDEMLLEKKEKMLEEFEEVKLLWDEKFLEDALVQKYDIEMGDIFEMLLLEDEKLEEKVFNFNSYKEYKKKKKNMKIKDKLKDKLKDKKKQYKIVTDKLEKKYGLKKDTVVVGQRELADTYNINIETIRLWNKKGYIIEY